MEPYRFASGEAYGEPERPSAAPARPVPTRRRGAFAERVRLVQRRRAMDPLWGQRSPEERRRLLDQDQRDERDAARWREGGRR
ncbi:hypothetical protein GCM10027517_03210 [Phycicoccus ginsengisoli]